MVNLEPNSKKWKVSLLANAKVIMHVILFLEKIEMGSKERAIKTDKKWGKKNNKQV